MEGTSYLESTGLFDEAVTLGEVSWWKVVCRMAAVWWRAGGDGGFRLGGDVSLGTFAITLPSFQAATRIGARTREKKRWAKSMEMKYQDESKHGSITSLR